MPAVPLFLYGLGSFAASAFGFAGVLTFGVGIAIGSAAIALTVAAARRASKLDDPADAGYYGGQSITVNSTEAPRNIAYGEVNVGGVFTYAKATGVENRELYFEIAHTGHEIDSFSGWWLDDKFIPAADVDVAGDGSVDTNTGGHGLDDVASGPVLYLRGALGTSAQAVDSMLDSAFADITSNHRHRGCARSVIRCDLLVGFESKWNGRAPGNITAVIKGKKVYDPRLDTTFPGGAGAHRLATPSTWAWSDNPALIWADYRILAAPLGPGWDTDRIDYQSVFDAANACDVLVAIPVATTEKRFRCDLVVDASMEPDEVVSRILASMAGSQRLFNGEWHVYAGVWQTPDFALDESDLVGPIQFRKQPDTGSSDRYNQVKGEFFDRTRQWKRSPFVTVNNTTLRSNRDNGRILPKHLSLDGVSREYQAQRLAMRALNQADDAGILVFSAGYGAANIRIGDTGTVTISEFGWVAKSFRCVGVKAIDFLGYELKLKEDQSGNYTDPIEAEYSVRTAAGTISFGRVMPWYLQGLSSTYWSPRLTNVTQTNGSTYTKTGGAAATWDSAFYSNEGFNRCAVYWKFSQVNMNCGVGLNSDPTTNASYASVDYWLECTSAASIDIYISGVSQGSFGTATTANQFAVIADGSTVRFYQNDTLLFSYDQTSPVLYLDSSFYDVGAAVNTVSFGPIGGVGTGQIDPNAARDTYQDVDVGPIDFTTVNPGTPVDGGEVAYVTFTPTVDCDVTVRCSYEAELIGSTGGSFTLTTRAFRRETADPVTTLLEGDFMNPTNTRTAQTVQYTFSATGGVEYDFGLNGYITTPDGTDRTLRFHNAMLIVAELKR